MRTESDAMKRLNVEALRAKAIAQFNASNDLKERFLDGETFANVVVRETREKLASEEPNTPIDSFEQLETGWMADWKSNVANCRGGFMNAEIYVASRKRDQLTEDRRQGICRF